MPPWQPAGAVTDSDDDHGHMDARRVGILAWQARADSARGPASAISLSISRFPRSDSATAAKLGPAAAVSAAAWSSNRSAAEREAVSGFNLASSRPRGELDSSSRKEGFGN